MSQYPRVVEVRIREPYELWVRFDNHKEKIVDFSGLIHQPRFVSIKQPQLFDLVHIDSGGYGISWNDEADMSEYELWTLGKAV